jgi:hypothetical protein
LTYAFADAVKSAFGIFLFQYLSMLIYQESPTLLGDDLYANHNTCKAVLDKGLSFPFACKDESHPWIAEQYKRSEPETLTVTEWDGKSRLEHRYRWVNSFENRAEGEHLRVN